MAISTVFHGEHDGVLRGALSYVVAELCCVERNERAATHGLIGGKRETTEKSVESRKTEDVTRKSVKK